jgi:[acyl-carrier-protein] S-malonyltransferase
MTTDAAGLAWVFPGQGAQHPRMLEPFAGAPDFDRLCARVSDRLGFDVRGLPDQPPERLAANATSSLLTVLCSVLALRRFGDAPAPLAVAGYSVGQFSALHAAGMFDAEALFALVAERAHLMDEAVAAAPPGGMLAVIGLAREVVDAACAAAAEQGLALQLANDNAPGQVTLGGSLAGLDFAEAWLAPRRPRVMKRLPVAGAWHGPALATVVAPLRARLAQVALAPARCPVIDNTSGDWLALDRPEALLDALARQVAQPVLWQQGLRTLLRAGAVRCLECGWGDVLTRFGFFIDRSVRHEAVAPLPRERG